MGFERRFRSGFAAALILAASAATAFAHEGIEARIADLSRQIAQSPDDAVLYLRRGEYRRLGSYFNAALIDFGRAAVLAPDLEGLALARGRSLLAIGRIDAALAQLERACCDAPEDPTARVELGRALRAASRYEESAACFAEALRMLPTPRPEHFIEHADVLVLGPGGAAAAIAALDAGIGRVGAVVSLQLRALELEAQTGECDAALRRVDALIASAHRKEMWHLRRGELLEQASRPVAALEAYCDCIDAIGLLRARHRNTPAVEALAKAAETAIQRLRDQVQRAEGTNR
ncbi:MAG: tetratricopeptide repeat protein [Phycisphaerales bacterium]|nr:tetratricopeptide repeat protein [Phycisphaerales bacterium]